jgi:FkbM family methyltransferase
MKTVMDRMQSIGRRTSKLGKAISRNTGISRKAPLDIIVDKLDAIDRRLANLEEHSHGARATYVGNNRVLIKAVVANKTIAYLLEANDRLLTPWFIVSGRYENPLTNYFVKNLKPESHCLDLGANFGYFTCLFGRFAPVGRIVGVEADPAVAELTKDNVSANGLSEAVTVMNCAVSNTIGELKLFRRKTRSGNTSIVNVSSALTEFLGEAPSEEFTIRSLTVDALLPELNGRVDFVKIDVEGAEPLVFEGMSKMLDTNPNVKIVCEWSPGQMETAGFTTASFVSQLRTLGLQCYDIAEDGEVHSLPLSKLQNAPYKPGILLTLAH